GVKRVAMVEDKENNTHVPMDIYDEDGNKLIDEDTYHFEDILITGPSKNMVDKPAWTKSFISPEDNNVTINDMIVYWDIK
ncbi:MAG: hypothetical protein PHE31_07080, partial [Tissierellia bacterium]|nr:hypothetical protein [Tissierellia bacterium]